VDTIIVIVLEIWDDIQVLTCCMCEG